MTHPGTINLTPEASRDAAARILAARSARRPIEALPDRCRPLTAADGYAVQAALHDRLDETGTDRVAGFKIGCTSAVMQDYLGIAHPCAGRMRGRQVGREQAAFSIDAHLRLGIEAEIAVTLASGLGPHGAPFDRTGVARAVGARHASIEVVDDRYADFRVLGAPTLIADDFFHAGCVLGPGEENWQALDLDGLHCRLLVDGTPVASGSGGDIMGHPLAALAWLANDAAARDESLPAGAVITLGSMVQTQWIAAPCTAVIEVQGLRPARLRLE